MWFTRLIYLHMLMSCLLFAVIPDFITALRNVSVSIPTAVKRGDNALLSCNYDIENDTLYTVKWYKGRREFYRYTPKENPAWKIFPVVNGINVETSESNSSHVLLRQVPLSISGKFACEVSADAPSFHTSFISGEMEVVELPAQRPIITGIHSRYRLGDIVNGNCSSDYSKPAANLTWWINDVQVPPNYVRAYDVQKHTEENLESAVLEINFIIIFQHFIKGRLKIKCSAKIHDIYIQETEKLIEEDRPRILASGRSPDVNLYPFDQPNSEGEFNDQNELYLTHYKNKPSSAATALSHTRKMQLHTQQLLLVLVCLILPVTVMANLIEIKAISNSTTSVVKAITINSNDDQFIEMPTILNSNKLVISEENYINSNSSVANIR